MKPLKQIFADSLGIAPSAVSDDLSYQGINQWDSVAHMALVAMIEDEYGLMLDTDDIIDMNSYAKALSILARYGINGA